MKVLKLVLITWLSLTPCRYLQAKQTSFPVWEVKGATATKIRAGLPKRFESLRLLAFTLGPKDQNILLHFYSSPNFGKPLDPERRDVPYYYVSLIKQVGKGKKYWKRINRMHLEETEMALGPSEDSETIRIDGLWLDSKKQQIPIIRMKLTIMGFYAQLTNYWVVTFPGKLESPASIRTFTDRATPNEQCSVRFDRDEQGELFMEHGWVENIHDPSLADRPARYKTYRASWNGKSFESKLIDESGEQ